MKIQSLAIIFVLIVLPFSILLSEYTQNQIAIINTQTTYDSNLITATYDAVKAYQLNAFNSTSNDISNSKIRDIEASANTFLNSVKSNFKLSGNSDKTINEYVPAIVYTLYDGFYVYSPYENDISDVYTNQDQIDNASYSDEETIDGLKPYIYYSMRYVDGSTDVVITYSLDNYITIQGYVGGNYWNESGYYLTKLTTPDNGQTYYYNGAKIDNSEELTENIYIEGSTATTLPYVKYSGTKYYYNENADEEEQYFYIQNDEINYNIPSEAKDMLANNNSAYKFYDEAYKFTHNIVDNSSLRSLTYGDAVGNDGQPISENGLTGSTTIFGGNGGTNKDAEEEGSNFMEHKTAVIRYTINTGLSMSIANYDKKFGGDTAFSMPDLTEEDWYKLINKTSVITFLQGFPMGTRTYNGYAIVTNNKNKDVVTDESIYIVTNIGTDDAQYHRADEANLGTNYSNFKGFFNVDFERRTYDDVHYFCPRSETGSYISIVNNQTWRNEGDENNERESIYTLIQGDNALASAYYTALGRERYGIYRIAVD